MVTLHDRFNIMLVNEQPIFSPCYGSTLVQGDDHTVRVILDWLHQESMNRGGQGALEKGLLQALQLLFEAVVGGQDRAKFLVVVTDNSNNAVREEGLAKFFADMDQPLVILLFSCIYIYIYILYCVCYVCMYVCMCTFLRIWISLR
jgi:hypothetical protein